MSHSPRSAPRANTAIVKLRLTLQEVHFLVMLLDWELEAPKHEKPEAYGPFHEDLANYLDDRSREVRSGP